MEPALVDPTPSAPTATASGCPVAHHSVPAAASNVCPFPHQTAPSPPRVRSKADLFVRRLLLIHERPPGVSAQSAYTAFRRSMMISATRCTLTYVIFPFVIPAIGFATGVGPALGIAIGVIAMNCDVFTIRRFFMIDHKYRWYVATIAGSVICLLAVLLVQDIAHLVT